MKMKDVNRRSQLSVREAQSLHRDIVGKLSPEHIVVWQHVHASGDNSAGAYVNKRDKVIIAHAKVKRMDVLDAICDALYTLHADGRVECTYSTQHSINEIRANMRSIISI